jgi:hypothetical protein
LCGSDLNLTNATDEDIKKLVKKCDFEAAPESNLIVK